MLLAQLDIDSTYLTGGLPGLIVLGIGMGLAMPASIQTATLGVRADHAGVASAVVSTAQQIGVAIGIAVLNTLAATAATDYTTSHATTNPPSAAVLTHAQMASYTTAFWWSAAIFLAGALITAFVFRRRTRADRGHD